MRYKLESWGYRPILSYGAMAGAIGGGGLGSVALMRGHARNQRLVLWTAVIILVILVQIIQTVGSGMSNKEIAKELSLSEGTVRNSISNILFKLGLRDRTQLAIWAVQTGAVNHPL